VNVLLDTNAFVWWLLDSPRIAGEPRRTIADESNTIFVSAASTWEMAIKLGLRRLDIPPNLQNWLPEAIRAERFVPLPVTVEHSMRVEALPRIHGDPFDRLLVAQALMEGCWLVTGDRVFGQYGVPTILC
jgi:PIN domain nuclease of toxin-antitoxin system